MIDILTCFTSVKTPVKSIAFVPLFPYWKKNKIKNPLVLLVLSGMLDFFVQKDF